MRYFVFLLLTLGCTPATKTPLLKEGACYSIDVYSTGNPSGFHELSKFKIIKIFEWEKRNHYAIQVIRDVFKKNGDYDLVPLYPKTKTLGYSAVDEFDKYISPIAGIFWPLTPKSVICKSFPEEYNIKVDKPRLPLERVGSDIDGTAK